MFFVGRDINHRNPRLIPLRLLAGALLAGALLTGCHHGEAPTAAGYYAGPMKPKQGWNPGAIASAKRPGAIDAARRLSYKPLRGFVAHP